jgi:hypothetical protein
VTDSINIESNEVLAMFWEISAVIQSKKKDSLPPACSSNDGANRMSHDLIILTRHDGCRSEQSVNGPPDHSTSSLQKSAYSDSEVSPGPGVARGVLLMACLYLAIASAIVTLRYGTPVLIPAGSVMIGLAFLVHRLLAPLFAPEAWQSSRLAPSRRVFDNAA